MKSNWNRKWSEKVSLLIFLLPTIVFLFVFIAYPVAYSGYLSLTEYDFARDDAPTFIGLRGYVDMVKNDSFFHTAFINQMKFALPYILITFFISLSLAILVSELTKGVQLFQIIFYLPMIISLSMAGITFSWILNQDVGIFNHFLRTIGFESLTRHWFGDPSTALMGLIVIRAWKMIGFTFIIFLSGIHGIPMSVREAARVDGTKFWQEIRHIILPLLKPYLLAGGIWIIINSMKVFDLPQVVTQGGPGVSTLTLYLYSWKLAFQRFDMGQAARVAYATAALILGLTWGLNRILKPDTAERY